MIENEMVGWHHRLHGHESVGDSEGQGSLVCCNSWGHRKSDRTERLAEQQQTITILMGQFER